MTSRNRGEILLGGAISTLLLIFAATTVFFFVTASVRGFAASSRPGTCFDTAIFFGFIAYTDYPEKIRKSKYLRWQAGILIWFLFLVGFAGLFSRDLERYEEMSKAVVIAVACVFALFTLGKLVHHYVSTRRLTDDDHEDSAPTS